MTPANEAPRENVQSSLDKIAQITRRQKRRTERLVLLVTLGFVGAVALLAWFTDGRIISQPWHMIMAFEAPSYAPRDAGLNCQNPKNQRTPYCMDRKARVEGDWMSISRYHEGKSNPFTLHEH